MNISDGSIDSERSPDRLTRVLVLLVDVYRLLLGPILGGWCRFAPSCSTYTREALLKHGARRGTGLAVRRLLRCHPLCPGGYDPVP